MTATDQTEWDGAGTFDEASKNANGQADDGPIIGLSLDAFLDRAANRVTEWTVDGLIESGGLFVMGGHPKTLKTWATVQLGMAACVGGEWMGRKVRQGAFMLVTAEGTETMHAERLHQFVAAIWPSIPPEDRERFHIVWREGVSLDDEASLALVKRQAAVLAERYGNVTVAIDPLRDYLVNGASENDSAAIGVLKEHLRTWLEKAEVGTLSLGLLHHTTKASGNSSDSRSHSGSGAIFAMTDTSIIWRRTDEAYKAYEASHRDNGDDDGDDEMEEEPPLGGSSSGNGATITVAERVHGYAKFEGRSFAPLTLKWELDPISGLVVPEGQIAYRATLAAALAYVRRHPRATTRDIAKPIGVHPNTVRRALTEYMESHPGELLSEPGPTRHGGLLWTTPDPEMGL